MEGAEKEGGTIEAVGLSVFVCGHFGRSWASLHRTCIDGTHGGEERRVRNGNGEVSEDTRDSGRKDELITCSCILIDI